MSNTRSALEPEKRLNLTTVCSIVGICFAIAAVLAGWNATHAEMTIEQSHSLNNYIICVGAALISAFFFYNAFAATDLPPAMTPFQEARARKLYSSVAYGPVMRDLDQDLNEKSKWPETDGEPEIRKALQVFVESSNCSEKLAAIEYLQTKTSNNLILAVTHAQTLGKLGRFSEAEKETAALLQRQDLSSATRVTFNSMRLTFLAQTNDKEKLSELLEKVLSQTPDALEKAYLLDGLCCAIFYQNCPRFLGDADRWSQLALELQPDLLTLKGTRGSVLVELGREDEAVPLLREDFENSEALNDKGLSSLYLGIAAKRCGNIKAAKKWFRRAHELWPTAWLIERIKAESTSMKQKV